MTARILIAALAAASAGFAGAWSKPVEVTHDDARAISYRARVSGEYLIVEIALAPGWHTFALDNRQRAEEKLAGKRALSQDKPTEVKIVAGLTAEGGWMQPEPKDFSQPEIRSFSWGFEGKATLMTKVLPAPGAKTAKLEVHGQACTPAVCKNVNVEIDVPLTKSAGEAKAAAEAAASWKRLTPVRQQ